MSQTRFEEAIEAYDRYLDKAKRESDFYEAAQIAKALCYEGLRQYSDAAALLDQLSQTMDPSDARYHAVRFDAAMFYQEAGDDNSALDLFRKISEEATGALQARATVWVRMIE
jgi:tetratricopeptide (TPR) repeat protein